MCCAAGGSVEECVKGLGGRRTCHVWKRARGQVEGGGEDWKEGGGEDWKEGGGEDWKEGGGEDWKEGGGEDWREGGMKCRILQSCEGRTISER
jgi:hypothetical protein